MNKLAEFPLERAGFAGAPDDTVIVSWPGWSLTVGDVRTAATPQHSVAEQASKWRGSIQQIICDLPLPKGSEQYRGGFVTAKEELLKALEAHTQPLASTAATKPEQALPSMLEGAWTQEVIAKARAALVIPASTAASEQQAEREYFDRWPVEDKNLASEQQAGADELPPIDTTGMSDGAIYAEVSRRTALAHRATTELQPIEALGWRANTTTPDIATTADQQGSTSE